MALSAVPNPNAQNRWPRSCRPGWTGASFLRCPMSCCTHCLMWISHLQSSYAFPTSHLSTYHLFPRRLNLRISERKVHFFKEYCIVTASIDQEIQRSSLEAALSARWSRSLGKETLIQWEIERGCVNLICISGFRLIGFRSLLSK